MATATIIGGSFSDRGGHTPVEPIQFGSVVIHGPDVSNHANVFTALHEDDATIAVSNTEDLQKIFETSDEIFKNSDICKRAKKTIQTLRNSQSDLSEVVAEVKARSDL